MDTCLYCHSPTPLGATFCCRACEILHSGEFQFLKQRVQLKHKQKWAALDTAEARQLYSLSTLPDRESFRLYVDGLQCASCIHLLEKMPELNPQILKAEILFGSSEMLIDCQKDLPLSEVFSLIEEMGFTAHLLKADESAQESWRRDSRQWLKEIAVAGACTGNIMMFIVPVYSGVEDPYRRVFLWLSFALFLPIVIYSARSIYQGAWRALKTRQLNTDLSLTVALWGGFALSTYNLLHGSEDIYFDSTASFLFLILVSRFFVKKMQRQTLNHLQKQESIWDASYLRQEADELCPVIAPLLMEGDVITLKKNQILPCDSLVLTSQSEWDSSLTTGEVLPRLYGRNVVIHAGHRLLSEEVNLKVIKTHGHGELQQMLQMISRQSLSKSRFVLKMDVWSQRLLLTVFVIGIVFLAAYSLINVEEALQRTLALWIVACPCALAFAAPLTMYQALLKARSHGLLIKNPDVFEKAKNIKELIFDKTGTLTTGQLQLVKTTPAAISQCYKDIVLQLENNSQHPVAFAFRKAWPEGCQTNLSLTDIHEVIGEKVYGLLSGKMYAIRGVEACENLVVELLENNQRIASFEFKDELLPDTKQALSLLQNKFPSHILSGDTSARVAALTKEVGLSAQENWSEHSPLQKWQKIKHHPQALMMGDGANDAAALQEAYVSVAAHGSLEMSARVADIYLLKKGLQPILSFFKLSERYQFVLRRNFILAITYNSVAGVCALLGWINPLVAALLMPLSSLLLLFSTMEGWS